MQVKLSDELHAVREAFAPEEKRMRAVEKELSSIKTLILKVKMTLRYCYNRQVERQ